VELKVGAIQGMEGDSVLVLIGVQEQEREKEAREEDDDICQGG
jgi:hypothetical protein